MNDFLTRMVQRHRGELPIVRPRLAPLFAPGVEPTADQLSEQFTWSQSAPTVSEPTSTGKEDDRARWTVEPESLVRPPRLPIVNRAVDAPSPAGRADGESASEAPRRQVPAQERRPVVEEHQPGPERTVTTPSAPAEPQAAPDAVTTLSQRIVLERVARTERVEVIPRLVRQDISRVRPLDPPPSLIAAPASRGQFDSIDHDAAETPVQVTIGRIEVTAVAAPPSPKRKTSPRQPSMSLQAYLSRRQDKGVSR